MRPRAKVGDIFSIPLGDGRAYLGQIVAKYLKASYYVVVFDYPLAADSIDEHLDDALGAPILFIVLTLDAKIYHGDWPILGRQEIRDDIPFPAYKVAVHTPQNIHVVDYTGTKQRQTSADEVESRSERTTISPIGLELAVKAITGIEPWRQEFDSFRPNRIQTTTALFS